MNFLNRTDELDRLDGLIGRQGGFAVVYGRRRIGKTRMLVEWVHRHDGVYTVADQSAADIQRRYFAEALAAKLPGFADVEYRDWRVLFTRLAREAKAVGWRGPLVLDELPYLLVVSPDLPAVLQRWIDHEAAELVVVAAGSSQRMMEGLVLSSAAPLFGRAQEIMNILPLHPSLIPKEVGGTPGEKLAAYAAWGGVPRYWELAANLRTRVELQVDRLVLDPLGALHREPDHLIAEELPPASEVRTLLDAIGGGAHRVSEIGSRLGRPATSLSRPLTRLIGMGLVRRDVPFGEHEGSSKRSLYEISDPFTRMWFRVVAPHRSQLATRDREGRLALFRTLWPQLLGRAWEDLCRMLLPSLATSSALGAIGPWEPASRWWQGNQAEWDIVAHSVDGRRILFGEAKIQPGGVARALTELGKRPIPPELVGNRKVVRALFVGNERGELPESAGELVVSAKELFSGGSGGR